MAEFVTRFWENLIDRLGSPMNLRFILQPVMAVLLGIRDGLRFAREGRSFLLWGGPENPLERRAQALVTVRSIGKVFVLAIILDVVCRLIAVNWVFPLETLAVAISVAIVPYLVVRGLVNLLAKRTQGSRPPEDTR